MSQLLNSVLRKFRFRLGAIASAALLSAVFVSATAPRAQADDDRAKCQRRIEKSEERLERAIREHGERSEDARKHRHELNEERERCYSAYHGWWRGADHRWHEDRDWDRDDHDRDHH